MIGLEKPLVSICCITYNQEQFIRDAIEGFINQITDFDFEIIIHDDASTDGTASIIREYEAQYPNLIKPIYQVDNQYSQGISPSSLCYAQAQGDYIAICEGDDYWIDPLKLQKQVNILGTNQKCDICFHNAIILSPDSQNKELFKKVSGSNRVFSIEEVIMGGGAFMPSPSIMFRNKILTMYFESENWLIGPRDFHIQILGSIGGGAIFLDEAMSVYRRNFTGSWTYRTNNNYNLLINQAYNELNYIIENNRYTEFMYADAHKTLYERTLLSYMGYYRINRKDKNELYRRYGSQLKIKYKFLAIIKKSIIYSSVMRFSIRCYRWLVRKR
ncbi:MAG: glycosyltransferase family 2 protein [Eubacteriales bacterium]